MGNMGILGDFSDQTRRHLNDRIRSRETVDAPRGERGAVANVPANEIVVNRLQTVEERESGGEMRGGRRGQFARGRREDRGLIECGSVEAEGFEDGSGVCPSGMQEHSTEFFADAFAADAAEFGGVDSDGVGGITLDDEVKPSGEANGAEGTEVVFGEALVRVADSAEASLTEIVEAADVIDDVPAGGERAISVGGIGKGIEEEGVDGKVTARGVGASVAELDGVGAAGIGVGAVGAEGGDFDLGVVDVDEEDAEGEADEAGALEKGADVGWASIGGNVEIGGAEGEEFIANAPAGEVGGETGGAETAHHLGGGGSGTLWIRRTAHWRGV